MSRGELIERIFYVAVILGVLLPFAFGWRGPVMRGIQLVVFSILVVLLVKKIALWKRL